MRPGRSRSLDAEMRERATADGDQQRQQGVGKEQEVRDCKRLSLEGKVRS